MINFPPFVHALSYSLEQTGTDQTNPTSRALQNCLWRVHSRVRPPPKSQSFFLRVHSRVRPPPPAESRDKFRPPPFAFSQGCCCQHSWTEEHCNKSYPCNRETYTHLLRCCFAPPSGRNRQGHFQSILVKFSRLFPDFQSILVNVSLIFSQFESVPSDSNQF